MHIYYSINNFHEQIQYFMGKTISKTCSQCHSSTYQLCQKCIQPFAFCSKCGLFPYIQKVNGKYEVLSVCQVCFMSNLLFSFEQKVSIIGEEGAPEIYWLHGGGGSRVMFLPHAKIMASKGYRCILLDLPGHASRMNQKLTIQSAINSIKQAVNKYSLSKDRFLVGGSLGGYIAMEILGKETQMFKAAVVMMCGQNIGKGRGLSASIGLWAMKKGIEWVSETTIIKQLVNAVNKNKNIDEKMIQQMFKNGFYFKRGLQQIEVLKCMNCQDALKHAKSNILFLNGSEDHRDSEDRWLSLCKGRLKVYEGGDHFFSHDKRFFEECMHDIQQFITSNAQIKQN